MIGHNIKEIFVVQHQVDMRKSFDGLLSESRQLLLNPFEGDCVVFVGRCKRRIKILFGDKFGLWLCLRRFEGSAIKTEFRFLVDPCFVQISEAECLLDSPTLNFPPYNPHLRVSRKGPALICSALTRTASVDVTGILRKGGRCSKH